MIQSKKFNKVMIFGRPGSGKSTFALELHDLTKIPLYHLYKYFFTANWAKRDNDEFMQMQLDIVISEAWIIDGNCTQSLETRYSNADVCLYFNYSKIVCLWRICKRILQKRDHIDDRADDCPEIVRWQLIKYMWSFEKRVQDKIKQLKNKYPQVIFLEVADDKQAKSVVTKIIVNRNVQFNTVEPSYAGLQAILALSVGNPTEQKIHEILDSYKIDKHQLIGAFLNEQLIGVVGITINTENIIVNHIAVLDMYKASGVGRQLITYVVSHYQSKKIIAETDAESVGFYNALGFSCNPFVGPYGQRYKCELEESDE